MGETWLQDRKAINHVENIVLQLNWMWREQPILDYGIDGQIEICNADKKATGRLFSVQSKGGNSYFYRRKRDNVLTIRLNIKHLKYWSNYPLPVLVIGYLPSENVAYWLYIQDYISKKPELLGVEKSSVCIKIPNENRFTLAVKNILCTIPDRHLDLVANRIPPEVDIIDKLLQMAEDCSLDPNIFKQQVIEWSKHTSNPIKTRIAKSKVIDRLELFLHRLQEDVTSLPKTYLPAAKGLLQFLSQRIKGSGVRQVMDSPSVNSAQGSILIYWELGSQIPRMMLADYVGEVLSNRLSIILNSDGSLALRAYQKDGKVVLITSEGMQPSKWFVAIAVWEKTQISLWVNGKQFGPSLMAGFDHLGPLLLYGLDLEDKLSADSVQWTPIENMLGLHFKKGNMGHGAIFLSALLSERALSNEEISHLSTDPFALFRPRTCKNGRCPDCGSPVAIDKDSNAREPDKRIKRLDGSSVPREDFEPSPPAIWCVCTKCGRPCLSEEGFPI